MNEVLIKQLIASRSAIDAASAAIDAALLLVTGEQQEAANESECSHPSDKRQKIPVMGSEAGWFCTICGYVEQPGEVKEENGS